MENDHVIEALAPNGSYHSLYIGSLPRRARCRQNFADAQVSHLFSEVIVAQTMLRCCRLGMMQISHLLASPSILGQQCAMWNREAIPKAGIRT
jgi:hypothetical protein